jgi:hypothetical protein
MVASINQDYLDTPRGTQEMVVGTYETLRWEFGREFGPALFHAGTDAEISDNLSENRYQISFWASAGTMGSQVGNFTGQEGNYGMYTRLNNANRAIRNIREGVVDLGTAGNTLLAEALFNRAYAFYMLHTQLGEIPLKTEYTADLPDLFYLPKSSAEEIYKRIITDVRFAYDNLSTATTIGETALRSNRLTKGAAGHFLARLYLQRAQGVEFQNSTEPSLKALYKGNVATDLDSCIYYASQVIGSGDYELADNYADLFATGLKDWTNESNREIILSASFGGLSPANGPYGQRFVSFMVTDYYGSDAAAWGMTGQAWKYGHINRRFTVSDWGYDVFTDKMADSRFEKTFRLEYVPLIPLTSATGGTDGPYHAYDDAKNQTQTWILADDPEDEDNDGVIFEKAFDNASYFNDHILPTYDRASWNGRQAVSDIRLNEKTGKMEAYADHKIGTDDLGLVFLENSRATAIHIDEARSQPYVLYPRWVTDGAGKYYYRLNGLDNFSTVTRGLDAGGEKRPNTFKHVDPNREGVTSPYGSRDVAIFRLAETYLLRAEAYGRQGNFGSAIADINEVRRRAAYKPGEVRAEVLVRLYPGHETLAASEQQWPYDVATDNSAAMEVDATYWDGASAESAAENYVPSANTDLKRFIHFIYNELTREAISEMTLYEGIHHAGIQYERVQYHQQLGSTMTSNPNWQAADNVQAGGVGQNGQGKGYMQPFHTFRPWPNAFIELLQNEDGTMLDEAGRKAYQNPGY